MVKECPDQVKSVIGRSVDGWKIGDFADNGASAAVFRASKSGQEAAITIYFPDFVDKNGSDHQYGRLKRELLLVGHDHPNVVRIVDGQWEIENAPRLATERFNREMSEFFAGNAESASAVICKLIRQNSTRKTLWTHSIGKF